MVSSHREETYALLQINKFPMQSHEIFFIDLLWFQVFVFSHLSLSSAYNSLVLEEAQAGTKIVGRNINNLRYADDTILMAESEELKSLLMKVKEESEISGLKLNIQKTKIIASGPITSWQIDGETMETVTDFIFGLQNHCRQ